MEPRPWTKLRGAKLNDQTRAGIAVAEVPPLRLRDLPLPSCRLADEDFEDGGGAARFRCRQLGLVVIDYLQLVPSPRGVGALDAGRRSGAGLQASSAGDRASRVERSWCRSYAVRRKRPNARPALDDCGHLGAIKQHADVVLRDLWEEMYNRGTGVTGRPKLIDPKEPQRATGSWTVLLWRWMRIRRTC